MIQAKLKRWLTDANDFEKRGIHVFSEIDDDKLVKEFGC